MKKTNLNKILRFIVPSLFFILIAMSYPIGSWKLFEFIIAGIIILPIAVNLFLQNKIFSMIIGSFFLLVSIVFIVVLISDVFNEKATLGYLFGAFMGLNAIVMSILLIIGYKNMKY